MNVNINYSSYLQYLALDCLHYCLGFWIVYVCSWYSWVRCMSWWCWINNCWVLTCLCFAVHYNKRKKSLPVSQVPSSSRASVVLPLLSGAHPFVQKKLLDDIGECSSMFSVCQFLWGFFKISKIFSIKSNFSFPIT